MTKRNEKAVKFDFVIILKKQSNVEAHDDFILLSFKFRLFINL